MEQAARRADGRGLRLGGRALHGDSRRSRSATPADRADAVLAPMVRETEGRARHRAGSEMGPLVTREHRDTRRVYVELGVARGRRARGRRPRAESRRATSDGFFIGRLPVRSCHAAMSDLSTRRSSGPCWSCTSATSERAWTGQRPRVRQRYAPIFTDGRRARAAVYRTGRGGMVGINVPIPVPMAFTSLRRLEALAVRRLHVTDRMVCAFIPG